VTLHLEPIILIVDDDEAQVLMSRNILGRSGYQTLTATSSLQALEVARALSDPVELLLTDVDMPGLGGRALAAELRSMWPALRVLYLTAHPDVLFRHHQILGPREAFLEKPAAPQALGEAVRMLLRENLPD
jgi:CheY-like chemotaxis protein